MTLHSTRSRTTSRRLPIAWPLGRRRTATVLADWQTEWSTLLNELDERITSLETCLDHLAAESATAPSLSVFAPAGGSQP